MNLKPAPLTTEQWQTDIMGTPTSVSVSLSANKRTAIVAISQEPGFGSILDASEEGVRCLLGARRDGLEDACALSLVKYLGCQRVLLTIAMRNITQSSVRALLVSVSEHI